MTPNELFARIALLVEEGMTELEIAGIRDRLPEGYDEDSPACAELILDLVIHLQAKGVDVRKWLSDSMRQREQTIKNRINKH